MDPANLIGGLVGGGIVTLIGALLTLGPVRRKLSAEGDERRAIADASLAEATRQWVEPLERRARRAEHKAECAEAKADWCRARVRQLDDHIDVLVELLRDAGQHPPAKPEAAPLVLPRGPEDR
jgi:hypothetical protein